MRKPRSRRGWLLLLLLFALFVFSLLSVLSTLYLLTPFFFLVTLARLHLGVTSSVSLLW